jgi:hypothetical protein
MHPTAVAAIQCTEQSMAAQHVLLGKYSLGVGDRFAHQAEAQLRAFIRAAAEGVPVVPVWNKSDREHQTVGSGPADVRRAADAAVRALGWTGDHFVDADHIGLAAVDRYLAPCDFFTLDVAGAIGRPPDQGAVEAFLARRPELMGHIDVPGVSAPLRLSRAATAAAAAHYLSAVAEAGRIYRHLAHEKGAGTFATEISVDETDTPQTPAELLVILAAVADEVIPIQTVAPRFSGRFNKGVDYVGDIAGFERELRDEVAVVAHSIATYGLPRNLKLSVHSGSDKFSIFPAIHRALRDFAAGVHVKTSGTTWLEEMIGLAESGGDGLVLAKDIYAAAYGRREELCAPYASVIDIDGARLPSPQQVRAWSAERFTATLRHDRSNPAYDRNLRQLVHVGYKIAAAMGPRYTDLLEANEATIATNVTTNIYDRHLVPLFLGG